MKTSDIRLSRLVWPVIAAAAALPLQAVDGVVLINQNAALAGNVTPGYAPGFPVTISMAGSYRLSGNLTVPDANTNALEIGADDVTIDLNGFSITGPTVCSATPVTSCGPAGLGIGVSSFHSNIVVSNGTIRGMGLEAVSLFGSQERLEKIGAFSNGINGIRVLTGSVVSCTATNNGQHGIQMVGIAIGNTAEFNGGDGINIASGLAVDNTANFNAGVGLNGSVFIAAGNHAQGNKGAGDILAGCPSVVVSNKSAVGVRTSGSGCTIANNSQ